MPTYEFRCPKGHEFERFYRTISAAQAELTCPECGAKAERKISGGAGFAFKGSGFYLTDYGKNAHRGTKTGSPEGGSSESGSEGGKPQAAEPKAAEPKAAEPKAAEPKAAKPSATEPKAAEPKAAKPKKE